jgi:hypothetical protein
LPAEHERHRQHANADRAREIDGRANTCQLCPGQVAESRSGKQGGGKKRNYKSGHRQVADLHCARVNAPPSGAARAHKDDDRENNQRAGEKLQSNDNGAWHPRARGPRQGARRMSEALGDLRRAAAEQDRERNVKQCIEDNATHCMGRDKQPVGLLALHSDIHSDPRPSLIAIWLASEAIGKDERIAGWLSAPRLTFTSKRV